MSIVGNPEALVTLIVCVLSWVFFAGVFFMKSKNKSDKVDNHDNQIEELSKKFDKMDSKVNLIEASYEAQRHKLHTLSNEFMSFKSTTSNSFHNADKKQLVMIGMIERIGDKLNIPFQTAKLIDLD